jgi:GntR family transcriptional regulator
VTIAQRWVSTSLSYVGSRPVGSADAWSEEAAAQGGVGSQRLREVADVIPPPAVAAGLGQGPEATAVVRRRVIMLDGRPVELADSYYPLAVARGTRLAEARKIRGGSPTLLTSLGYPLADVVEDVSARPPSGDETRELELAEGEWVMVLFRVASTGEGQPVEVTVMTMRARDRHLSYRLSV